MSIFNYSSFDDLPFVELYMSDYLQLGFYCREDRVNNNEVHGFNEQDEEGLNIIMINLYWINKRYKEKDRIEVFKDNSSFFEHTFFINFVNWFNRVWVHEYFHLIGLSEETIGYMESSKCTIEVNNDNENEEDDE